LRKLHVQRSTGRSGCPRNLRTVFKTNVKWEPDGVRNASNKLSTGAGEIVRVKITVAFETLFGGPTKLMSEWTTTGPQCAAPEL
jgi:hypothetical protein